jgi:uncharacterized membrane protein YedE/YeeE
MLTVASLACGFIVGLGLLVSGMVQPAKVLSFLDIFGAWDPSLAVVMLAALVVSDAGFALARRRQTPILVPKSLWPLKTDIDRPLVIGSALFRVGWGLVGLCPGPASSRSRRVSSSSSSPWPLVCLCTISGRRTAPPPHGRKKSWQGRRMDKQAASLIGGRFPVASVKRPLPESTCRV